MNIGIGIDIGGTNIKIVLVSEDGNILHGQQYPTPHISDKSKYSLEHLLMNDLREFLEGDAAKIPTKDQIAGIGIGVAGLIDRKRGVVIKSPNISGLDGLPLRGIFEKEFSLPVVLENDANAYAYGEKWIGTGKELNNCVVLTLGTGLGGGLIYNGELYEGPVEIGHMSIVPSGRYCTCGSCGCLESYASGRAIVDRAVSSLEKGTESLLSACCDGNFYKITPEVVYETALEGDNLSREVFREVGQFLGIGVANLINILSLEAVIIGGGLVGAWDLFIEEMKKEISRRALKPLSANIRILKSTLTKNAGSVGAAGLLLKKIGAARPGGTSQSAS